MRSSEETIHAGRFGVLEIITLILSVYVLLTLFVQFTIPLSGDAAAILDRVDFVICFVFLADFFLRLYRAPSKKKFLKWGWIDFVSSIPMVGIFRIGRVVRVVRILRMLRAFRSMKNLVIFFLSHRKLSSLAAVATICFTIMVFSAVAVLSLEDSPDANIKDAGDAFWWAFVTMTTGGRAEKYPVSGEGRIVGCILMTAGAALFATFTAFIASLFVHPEQKTAEMEIGELRNEVRLLTEKIDDLTRDRTDQAADAFR
jgi:voltage-gated potassium channel